MNRRRVTDDVGTVYGRVVDTRPEFDLRGTARDIGIIGTDLHCNAARIRGQISIG